MNDLAMMQAQILAHRHIIGTLAMHVDMTSHFELLEASAERIDEESGEQLAPVIAAAAYRKELRAVRAIAQSRGRAGGLFGRLVARLFARAPAP